MIFVLVKKEQKLVAYYTIALKPFELDKNLSSSQRRKLIGTGVSGANVISGLLIGQISKNYSDNCNKYISGKILLGLIFKKVKHIDMEVPTQIVFLDCRPIEKLRKFYISLGFEYFNTTTHEGGEILETYTIPTRKIIKTVNNIMKD